MGKKTKKEMKLKEGGVAVPLHDSRALAACAVVTRAFGGLSGSWSAKAIANMAAELNGGLSVADYYPLDDDMDA